MITKLTRAVIGVALTPITVIADIITLPSSAYNDQKPFGKTASIVNIISKNIKDSLK